MHAGTERDNKVNEHTLKFLKNILGGNLSLSRFYKEVKPHHSL